jgi:hypothetical protein
MTFPFNYLRFLFCSDFSDALLVVGSAVAPEKDTPTIGLELTGQANLCVLLASHVLVSATVI